MWERTITVSQKQYQINEKKKKRTVMGVKPVSIKHMGYSGFRHPSMNDRLDISEIFLKGP